MRSKGISERRFSYIIILVAFVCGVMFYACNDSDDKVDATPETKAGASIDQYDVENDTYIDIEAEDLNDNNPATDRDIIISGVISNLEVARKYISNDTSLQLVPLSGDQLPDYVFDAKGRKAYPSNLPEISIPSDNNSFCFQNINMEPGQYGIVVQHIGPYENGSNEGDEIEPVLMTVDGNVVQIGISETSSSHFSIEIGEAVIPVPDEAPHANATVTGTKPSAPSGVSASDGASVERIIITWDPSDKAKLYEIYRADSFMGNKTKIGSTTGTSYEDITAPQCNIDYYYWVKAVNSYGSSDFFYNDLGYRRCPAPLPPQGLTASAGTYTDMVRISWKAPDGADSYDVFRAMAPDQQKTYIGSSATTTYDDKSAICPNTYYYWVQAINKDGSSGFSNYDSGSFDCSKAAGPGIEDNGNQDITLTSPTGVSATDGTFLDKVRITWGPVSGATSYEVYRSTALCSVRTKIGTTSATSFDDVFESYTRYIFYYWVKAKNGGYSSEYSAYDKGHLMFKPDRPARVSASDGAYVDKIRVTWSSSPRATAYEIYRSVFPGAEKTLLATINSTTYDDTDVKFSCYPSSGDIKFYYYVKASNAAGISEFSGYDDGHVYQRIIQTTNVKASKGTICSCIRIEWESVDDAASYQLYRSSSLEGNKEMIASLKGTCSFIDSRVTCPNEYYYWVKSVDKKGIDSCEFSGPASGYCSACYTSE